MLCGLVIDELIDMFVIEDIVMILILWKVSFRNIFGIEFFKI